MRQAVEIELTNEERATLESWSKGQRVEVRQALLAKIVLLSAEGMLTKDIAAKLNISYGYFEQLFKSETGTTPKKYLNVLRLRKAVQLITRRNFSVTVAAASVGYADVFAFSRAFKNHYGVSPSEYKKAYLEEKQVTLIRSKDILRGELRSMVEEK